MPTVFRAMKKDTDDLPSLGSSSTSLGVRLADFDIDPVTGMVLVTNNGASISPSCRQLPQAFRPTKFPGGLGTKNVFCFRMGEGTWEQGILAPSLEAVPDGPSNPNHGVIRPERAMSVEELNAAFAATRSDWHLM